MEKLLKTPDDFFEKIKNYFNKERKFIFITTIIIGLLAHFLLITNLIFSQDGILNTFHYTAGDYEACLGRWGINFFDSLRNNIGLPFITTLISIILMCFTNILLIELFEIKSKFFKILTVLSVVVSPSLCMTLLYTYTADVYLYAMFFSVFSVFSMYKMQNKKLGTFFGVLSFFIMLSLYQSYMGFTVGLIIMLAIKELLTTEKSSFEVLKKSFFSAIKLLIAGILYYAVTKILLKTKGLSMAGYKGADQISIKNILISFVPSLKTAYLSFVKYFFADGVVLNRAWKREKLFLWFYGIFAISFLMLIVKIIKKSNNKKDVILRIILSIICILLLPLGLNIIAIMAPGNKIYYLIATQMILIFPFVFMIFEMLDTKKVFENLLNWVAVIISFVIMFTYFMAVVVTYQTAELSFEQAKSVSNRVLERMEETPGYRTDMNKLFAGVIDDLNFPKTLDLYNYAVTNSLRGSILHGTYMGQEITWRNFFNIYLGIPITFCSDYEYYTIITSDEFEEMEVFPAENSVKIINDVMVVKFTKTPQYPPISNDLLEHGIYYKQ